MKGFVKACLIAVLVFVVVGVVLLVVAVAGGVTRASLRLFSDQGRLSYGPVKIYMGDGFSVDLAGNLGGHNDSNSLDSNMVTEKGSIIVYQGGVYVVDEPVSSLYVDVDSGDFTVLPSEDEHFYIECNKKEVQVRYEDGRLTINGDGEDHWISVGFRKAATSTIYIPSNVSLDEIAIEVDAGDLTIAGAIQADVVKIEVDAGDVDGYECITAEKSLEMEVDAGDITIDDMKCKGILSVDCDAGNIEASGKVYGDIIADCDVGKITLDLIGPGIKYHYKIDSGLGNISVNDFEYTGIDQDIYLEGDVNAPKAQLFCDVGSLEVCLQ